MSALCQKRTHALQQSMQSLRPRRSDLIQTIAKLGFKDCQCVRAASALFKQLIKF